MILSSQQLQELFETIDYFHTLFIARNVGVDILTETDRRLLLRHGINADLLKDVSKIEDAFKFGILSSALKDKRIKKMSYEDFKRFLRSGNFIPLTKAEEYSLQAVKQQAYGDIKGLGNRINQRLNQVLVEHSKKQRIKVEKIIRETLNENIANRGSTIQLSSELGHRTKDWARDFDRISDYVMHDAFQHGISTHLLTLRGEDVYVYFDVYEGACDHCIRVYLTGGIGSEPKVFKLKDVLKNGSNIGVKPKEYKPSVSPLHPWCRCTMVEKPENSVWNPEKRAFVLERNTYGVNRKSKIKVTIS